MEQNRTTPEQSVILKNIGYDVPDTHYYSSIMSNTKNLQPYRLGVEKDFNSTASFRYTRPKLTDVATWLREVKGWHISVFEQNNEKWMSIPETVPRSFCNAMFDNKETHDIALSVCIDFILTKLNSK